MVIALFFSYFRSFLCLVIGAFFLTGFICPGCFYQFFLFLVSFFPGYFNIQMSFMGCGVGVFLYLVGGFLCRWDLAYRLPFVYFCGSRNSFKVKHVYLCCSCVFLQVNVFRLQLSVLSFSFLDLNFYYISLSFLLSPFIPFSVPFLSFSSFSHISSASFPFISSFQGPSVILSFFSSMQIVFYQSLV